jgi:hypothetical protein
MSPSSDLSSSEPERTRSDTPLLLILSADIMLASRIEAPARTAGFEPKLVASLEALRSALAGERSAMVLLDLADASLPYVDALESITNSGHRVGCLGIYPHVRDELGKDAVLRGCDTVLTRSRFFTDVTGALRTAAGAGLPAIALGDPS